MGSIELRLIETLAVMVIALVVILTSNSSVARIAVKYGFGQERIKFIKKIIKVMVLGLALMILLLIWGVDQKEFVLFLTSLLAVVGIALFAQWSMLSNITASILLFTSHPAKIGDTIEILDKDLDLSGKIIDIGLFFISIRTEQDQLITVPNSLLFQKLVKVIPDQSSE